jgi:hypothetical protein
MSDTNDLREQAIRAAEKVTDVIDDLDLWHELVAESILAVADPIIRADERRKVIEELAQRADRIEAATPGGQWQIEHIVDWLRANIDQEND